MTNRAFWLNELETAFASRSVVWLGGVRRVGKTTLARSLPGVRYFDCELVRIRRALEDAELFWRDQPAGSIVVLDEIHRLTNPYEVLKVAADHFPKVRVVATGPSTLAARRKFKDSLAGRKREVWLTPMIAADLQAFGSADLDRRMLHGGLPPFLLADAPNENDFQEWMDSYWAKDIQEMFRLERRQSFLRFVELLLTASGGIFEATRYARASEVSRPTIANYLSVLETTYVAHVIRPYSTGKVAEIVAAPKVYGFDTGFVAYHRGWDSLRDEDRGQLLEHLVLGEIAARFGVSRLHYWRDKQQHEVDFVLEVARRRDVVAIECKSAARKLDPASLMAFRRRHPGGRNLVVTLRDTDEYKRSFGEIDVEFVPYLKLPRLLDKLRGTAVADDFDVI